MPTRDERELSNAAQRVSDAASGDPRDESQPQPEGRADDEAGRRAAPNAGPEHGEDSGPSS